MKWIRGRRDLTPDDATRTHRTVTINPETITDIRKAFKWVNDKMEDTDNFIITYGPGDFEALVLGTEPTLLVFLNACIFDD